MLFEVLRVFAAAATREPALCVEQRAHVLETLAATLRYCSRQHLLESSAGNNGGAGSHIQQAACTAAVLAADLLIDILERPEMQRHISDNTAQLEPDFSFTRRLAETGIVSMLSTAVRWPAITAGNAAPAHRQQPVSNAAAAEPAVQLRPGSGPATRSQQPQPDSTPMRRLVHALELFVQHTAAAAPREQDLMPAATHVAAVFASTGVLAGACQVAVAIAAESTPAALAARAEAVIRCQAACQLIHQVCRC